MSKLASLKAAFSAKNHTNHGYNFFPFWKMEEGSTITVRFLPDLDDSNPIGFLVENLTHELIVNGDKQKIPCLQMYDEHCPICQLSRDYYDEKNEALGKKYYRKKSYIGQVIVIDSPVALDQNKLVRPIEFGPTIFKQIQAAFQSGDLEEPPYEFRGGYHFRIRKTKNGEFASYATSNFSPKQTDLSEETIEAARSEMVELSTLRQPKIPLESVQAMLLAERTGSRN